MFILNRVIGVSGPLQLNHVEIVGEWSCSGSGPSGGVDVELRIVTPAGGPAIPFTAITGTGFLLGQVTFTVKPVWVGLECGTSIKFEVRGNCGGTWTAWESLESTVECLCPIFTGISASYAPCVGNPPTQDVTFTGNVIMPPGQTMSFKWHFGDGQLSALISVNNPGGWNPIALPPTLHTYQHQVAPYKAELVPANECPGLIVPVQTTCTGTDCPAATITVIDQGECVNGQRTVTLHAQVTAPAGTPAFGLWNLGYAPPGGAATGKAFFVPAGQTQTPAQNPNLAQTWTYPPGSYTVFLDLGAAHPNCPNPSSTFTVNACPVSCEVLLDYTPKSIPCVPSGGSATVAFVATLSPANATYTGPFLWEVTKAGVSQTKVTQSAPAFADPHRFSHTFTTPGVYDVTVTVATSGCSDPFDTATASPQIVIKSCCPMVTDFMGQSVSACTWAFAVQVDNPNNVALTYEWSFHDGTTASTAVPNVTHTYPIGGSPSGPATVTVKAAGCPDGPAPSPVMVTVTCVCPTVGLPTAVVTGCIPTAGASPSPAPAVTLGATVSGAAATSFAWSVTNPAGTTFTKTTTAPTTTDGTTDGSWINTTTGSIGVLPLGTTGGYAVTVRASGPAIDPLCNTVSAPVSFTVSTCPVVVPPTSACSIWCMLAGHLLIALPISAFISASMFCFLPFPSNVITAGAIAFGIGTYILLCGVCCLWIHLLIGSGLGLVATLIAAYWFGFPICWLSGLAIMVGFLAMSLGIGARCGWRP